MDKSNSVPQLNALNTMEMQMTVLSVDVMTNKVFVIMRYLTFVEYI